MCHSTLAVQSPPFSHMGGISWLKISQNFGYTIEIILIKEGSTRSTIIKTAISPKLECYIGPTNCTSTQCAPHMLTPVPTQAQHAQHHPNKKLWDEDGCEITLNQLNQTRANSVIGLENKRQRKNSPHPTEPQRDPPQRGSADTVANSSQASSS